MREEQFEKGVVEHLTEILKSINREKKEGTYLPNVGEKYVRSVSGTIVEVKKVIKLEGSKEYLIILNEDYPGFHRLEVKDFWDKFK